MQLPPEESRPSLQRFRFTAFDAPPPTPAPTPSPAPEDDAPPPPPITVAERDAAVAEAYARGETEGQRVAAEAFDQAALARADALQQVLSDIANRILLAEEESRRHQREQSQWLEQLALGIARKVAGDALRDAPLTQLRLLLKEAETLLADQPRITLSVAPGEHDAVQAALPELQALLPGADCTITLAADNSLAPGDCRVAWHQGEASIRQEALWQAIEARLLPKTDAPTDDESNFPLLEE